VRFSDSYLVAQAGSRAARDQRGANIKFELSSETAPPLAVSLSCDEDVRKSAKPFFATNVLNNLPVQNVPKIDFLIPAEEGDLRNTRPNSRNGALS